MALQATAETTGSAPPPPLAPTTVRRRRSWRTRLRHDWMLLALAAPGAAVVVLFHYVPLLGNVIAFKDYQPYVGITNAPWVGLDNFRIIVTWDPAFRNALLNTVIIALIQVLFVFPVPIALALVLNSLTSERIKRVVQSVLYLPHFMSWVIVVAIFQQMLGGSGLLHTWLRTKGIEAPDIIGNPDVFKELITAQVIWKDTGWGTILFLAALSRIDLSLYEAAAADGASRMRQLWHVTLPGLRSVIVLLLILKLGDVLTVGFEQILLQQNAVGVDASEVLDTYVYNNSVIASNWGESAAVGLVKGIIGVSLVLTANKIAHMFGERGVYQ
ncbi:MAG: sugar ABC transporter permease [Hamadaea sp.]|nr:sugar ABC transporter permease [Hamadaea sp.]NUT04316.1 sugar ABC transporter permease [Hamadaea sp.]